MKCSKVRYRTALDAKVALALTHSKQASRREEARIYRCPGCHGWHLTKRAAANTRPTRRDQA